MVIQFKRILAPTDFSPQSVRSLQYALGVTSPGSVIILCHVVDDLPLTYGYVGLVAPTPELRAEMTQEAERELETHVPQPLPDGVTMERRVLHGAPFLEIVRCAREENADLIVMGTHGRSGLQQILIGSVAEKVVRKAPCPVLVVREKGNRFQHP